MRTCIITGASSGIGQATAIKISNIGEFTNIVLILANHSDKFEQVHYYK